MATGDFDGYVSFTRATIVAAAGLLAAFATQTTQQTILPAALTGADGLLLKGPQTGAARTINVTTSVSAAAYVAGSKVTVTGIFSGKVVTEALALVAAGGGDLIKGVQAFDYITSIVIDPQGTTSGQFSLGVGDIVAPNGGVFRRIKAHTGGNVSLQYQGGYIDVNVMTAGAVEACAAQRVLQATSVGVSVYY